MCQMPSSVKHEIHIYYGGRDGDKIYIGSTSKQFISQRMATHRSCYKFWKSGGKGSFTSSFELLNYLRLNRV
jgi:hypothetical protein